MFCISTGLNLKLYNFFLDHHNCVLLAFLLTSSPPLQDIFQITNYVAKTTVNLSPLFCYILVSSNSSYKLNCELLKNQVPIYISENPSFQPSVNTQHFLIGHNLSGALHISILCLEFILPPAHFISFKDPVQDGLFLAFSNLFTGNHVPFL